MNGLKDIFIQAEDLSSSIWLFFMYIVDGGLMYALLPPSNLKVPPRNRYNNESGKSLIIIQFQHEHNSMLFMASK